MYGDVALPSPALPLPDHSGDRAGKSDAINDIFLPGLEEGRVSRPNSKRNFHLTDVCLFLPVEKDTRQAIGP